MKISKLEEIGPGVALAATAAGSAVLAQAFELRVFGHAPVESIAIAIVIGAATRTILDPGPRWSPGVRFSGHELLEFAVLLLGASVSASAMRAAGVRLMLGIVAVVALSIASSYLICRTLRLRPRLAILVACGNSICGNSAIAAIAPVIGAEGQDVATSIAFTAVLGVALVLGLPLLAPILHLDNAQYGVFAGMTAYAVPQVLAATLPVSILSQQIGAIVKLTRVMMLAPVALFFSIAARRFSVEATDAESPATHGGNPQKVSFVPWFIVGFLALATARSFGMIPTPAALGLATVANLLTVVAMAALGLAVDLRDLARAGPRVVVAVIASLTVLATVSLVLIHVAGPS